MNDPGKARRCGLLSDDLWAKVFLLSLPVESGESNQVPPCWDTLQKSTITRRYCCFQKLRMTCHQFNEVFLRHPELSACVYLSQHLSQDALPSLIPWLQRRIGAVRTCIMDCGTRCAEPALATLSSERPTLLRAVTFSATNNTISSLALMTSLTACDLQASAVELALTPLSMLQSLRRLHLREGDFLMEGLAGLTYIDLDLAHVMCVNSSGLVNSVEELNMSMSTLIGLHPEGLAALTALKSLSLYVSKIAADVNAQSIDTKLASRTGLPAQMPVLSCITFLNLAIHCAVQRKFDISCLSTLNGLHELSVSLGASVVHTRVGPTLSCLSNLESLIVNCCCAERHLLTLQAPWHLMLRLQRVSFSAGVYCFSLDLLGVTQLTRLKEIVFLTGSPGDSSSFAVFGALAYNTAIHCPAVILKFPGIRGHRSPAEHLSAFKATLSV
ncbi:TPA: hypothetical protein ACH3X1_002148 [Trebouxia sp. C0004]